MNSKTNQNRIYKSVASRGYGPEAQGLNPDQFTARQVVKLLEEAMELAAEVVFWSRNGNLADLIAARVMDGQGIEQACKDLFDDATLWKEPELTDDFITELADVVIPLACAATAQRLSAMALGADKAKQDERRGVRKIAG